MKRQFILILILCTTITANAQTQPYGKINNADLEMTACDFEKGANAEILFDKGTLTPNKTITYRENIDRYNWKTITLPPTFTLERHIRIKIFNELGKGDASFSFSYYSSLDKITDLQAETINLSNGKVEITPLEKKLIYVEKANRGYSSLSFAMPEVKSGSVVEFKYTQQVGIIPTWYFQNNLPTRYSEIQIYTDKSFDYRVIPSTNQPFVKTVGNNDDAMKIRALANIRSLPNEPYMGGRKDNLQKLECFLINPSLSTWQSIGNLLCQETGFGSQFDLAIKNENMIIKQAKSLKSNDSKIAFIFNEVKNSMKWNGITSSSTADGINNAWNTKTGNSAEVNLIMYRLLKKSGIKAFPMVIVTKGNGKLNPASPNVFILNSTIVYIPVDSTKNYVLDATDKFNVYNEVPLDDLNSFGLSIDPDNKDHHELIYLQKEAPVLQSIYLNAEIKSDGQMTGTTQITSSSYNKIFAAQKYKTDGEEKYIDSLRNNDNNLKISSVKIDNMEIDSLQLLQTFDFNANLSGSDKDYVYFNANLFMPNSTNPFLSENRFSDIDFGYRDNFVLYGIYKIPAGYKVDALPKTVTIVMPDKSISFKRTTAEEDGSLMIKYVLNHEKTIYFKEDYQDIRGFYKRMYEMLNEQVVLKKL